MSFRISSFFAWRSGVVAVMALAGLALVGCSKERPTEPQQAGPPPTDAVWNITVTVSPGSLPVGTTDTAVVTVRVSNPTNGAAPNNGKTVFVTTTLGTFSNGTDNATFQLNGGQVSFNLIPGMISGRAIITATVDSSRGQGAFTIGDPGEFFLNFVDPNRGPYTGGNIVRIRGAGFVPPATVTFNGINAPVQSVNGGVIRVVVPNCNCTPTPLVEVPVTVALTNGDGKSASLASGYTYVPDGLPIIDSIDPVSGPEAGGTVITLRGSDLPTGNVRVEFDIGGSIATATIVSKSPSQMVIESPPKPALATTGTAKVTVRDLDTGNSADAPQDFVYTSIVVTSITPSSGSGNGGTTVSIRGEGFVDPVRVIIGGIEATVISVTPTLITATTGAIACGSVASGTDVVVENLGTGSSGTGASFTYNVAAVTSTTGLATPGPQVGGASVTFNGSGLDGSLLVTFGGRPVTSQTGSGTSLTVTAPGQLDSFFNEQACTGPPPGMEYVDTDAPVSVRDVSRNCTLFTGVYTYQPTDTSCRP